MTDLDKRYADSSRIPLICSQHVMPGTGHKPVLLAEYDTRYIYLWCRIGRHAHPVRLRDFIRMIEAQEEEASVSQERVL